MLRLATAVIALFLLAGCGDDDPASPADAVGTPSATSTDQGPMADLVTEVAPQLESLYAANGYPQSLVGVAATIGPAGITLPEGVEIGSYTLDTDAQEFTICLEDTAGAWASYDTAPMGVRDSGMSGGCPQASAG